MRVEGRLAGQRLMIRPKTKDYRMVIYLLRIQREPWHDQLALVHFLFGEFAFYQCASFYKLVP